MDRKGHYLTPGTRGSAPNVLFAVVQSPSIVEVRGKNPGYWEEWGGADVCVSKYRRGRWSALTGARCETPEALYDWMQKRADPAARNYVVTPDGGASLAVGRVWDHLCTAPVKWRLAGTVWTAKTISRFPKDTTWVRRCTLTPRCLIFDYSRLGIRWLWLNGHQHLNLTEDEIARTVGAPWEDTGEYDQPTSTTAHTSRARSVLWVRAYQQLADWWRTTAKAPFGLTAAAMSIGILRTHIADKTLCTHSNASAHKLERDASYGGMQRVWYYGDIGQTWRYSTVADPAPPKSEYGRIKGPLYQLDVKSMYPWLLRERRFPTKIADVYYRMQPNELLHWCRTLGVIARVTVETESPEYPLRVGQRIIYPVGRFTTALTGPELLRIAAEGRICHVHYVVTYLTGTPFKSAAAALLAMRDSGDGETNAGWSIFAKNVANSLGGKLAQKRGEWHEREEHPAQVPFGTWSEVRGRGRRSRRYKALAGLVWEWEPDATGAGPYTAAFAYLTAYGRLHMRAVRDQCPDRGCVAMDTDGLWVVDGAVSAVPHFRREADCPAGGLRVKSRVAAARFLGPKHYYTSHGWTLSGFAERVVGPSALHVTDTQRVTPLGSRTGTAPRGTSVVFRTSALAPESYGVSVGKDGWASPWRKRGGL